uniref:Uncharacterized protein n=1 Tax=Knipowitschia caucasica TaxID=637954 RepID=A0AAV2JWP6_KNICA
MADLRSALVATLGPSTVSQLQLLQHQSKDPQMVLEGFFPKPGAEVCSSSERSFIYINDRPVQHRDISKVSQGHQQGTKGTPARYHRDTSKVPQGHLQGITGTPARYHRDTCKVSQGHQQGTTGPLLGWFLM